VLRLIIICAGLLTFSSGAQAGAWAREKGAVFVSVGGNFWLSDGAQLPVYYDPTLYLEYGATEKLTLGLDIHTADAGRIATAFMFARMPLGDADARHKFAATLSLGARANTLGETESLIRGGLSWGMGLENGWLSVDASATRDANDPTFRAKVDFTYGHHWNDKFTTSLQLQTGQGLTNDSYAKIAPSLIFNLRENIQLSIGAVHALTGDRGTGLKFETWLSF